MKPVFTTCVLAFLIAAGFGCARKAPVVDEPQNANVETAATPEVFTDANAALAEGKRLLDENQTDAAIAALKQAVKLDPNLSEAYFQLGIAYSLMEMQMAQSGAITEQPANSKDARVKTNSEKAFEKAVEAYKKWIAIHPSDDVAQFNLGRTYSKLAQDEEAEKSFQQAVKLKPDDSEYQTELGAILIRLAKYREAIEPLKKAVALDDTNERAQELLDDAEAGRQRLDYVAPKKDANANQSANSNKKANTNNNSNSNSAPKPPPANAKVKKEEKKYPATNQPD